MHHWLFLSGAILLEVAGTVSMKLSEGFTRPIPSVLLFLFYIASFVFLTFALKKLTLVVPTRFGQARALHLLLL